MSKEYASGDKAFSKASKKNKSRLESHGDEFLVAYEALCRKHKLILDSAIGACNMRSATAKEITDHLVELRRWLIIDLAARSKGDRYDKGPVQLGV